MLKKSEWATKKRLAGKYKQTVLSRLESCVHGFFKTKIKTGSLYSLGVFSSCINFESGSEIGIVPLADVSPSTLKLIHLFLPNSRLTSFGLLLLKLNVEPW